MDISRAKKIMGKNFIGPEELGRVAEKLGIAVPKNIPKILFDEKLLKKLSKGYILILGAARNEKGEALTLNAMRSFFGFDPAAKEPCFYNQDWYLKEKFANKTTLQNKWYLIRKSVAKETRGERPDVLEKKLKKGEQFPSAILTAFTFFAYYFLNDGELLWKHDFIWCRDKDKNGDRIYTGRYVDPKKINKNGFNIHRHLSIRPVYGAAIELVA